MNAEDPDVTNLLTTITTIVMFLAVAFVCNSVISCARAVAIADKNQCACSVKIETK